MITTVIHCDRCQKVIDRERTHIVINCGVLRSTRIGLGENGGADIDLCAPCSTELSAWLGEKTATSKAAG